MTSLLAPSGVVTNTSKSGLTQSERFVIEFQLALQECGRYGFVIEECFGRIWMETLQEIPLTDEEQGRLYDKLISWAKTCLFS